MALKIISAEFIKGATKVEQFPDIGVAEFAFFGRSNVGKSSLINMLVNRKNLVKTGSRPGMTREVNFFLVNKPANTPLASMSLKKGDSIFMLVDLPGYGYAKLSGGMTQKIDTMLYDYCSNSPNLRTIFFLIDIRREPKEVEKQSIQFFQSLDIEVVVVATKADKVGKNDQKKISEVWAKFLSVHKDDIVLSSASKKLGRDVLLSRINAHCIR